VHRWGPVSNLLKRAKEEKRLKKTLASEDQGRSFHAISVHPASNSWIPTGRFLSFTEYKFALRARLNLLPVKTVAKRMRKIRDTTCPKCHSQPEFLGHVLNACTPNMGLMRECHNAVLRRVTKAIPKDGKDTFVEQSFSPDNLRPDIVVRDQTTGETTIVDVTVPYESGRDAFSRSRAEKVQKYASLKTWIARQPGFGTVSVYAIIVGSLGSWDPDNSTPLHALK